MTMKDLTPQTLETASAEYIHYTPSNTPPPKKNPTKSITSRNVINACHSLKIQARIYPDMNPQQQRTNIYPVCNYFFNLPELSYTTTAWSLKCIDFYKIWINLYHNRTLCSTQCKHHKKNVFTSLYSCLLVIQFWKSHYFI